MITASEARRLAGETVQEKVESICAAIEAAAKEKKRELKTSWDYKKDDDLWVNGGYSGSKEWKEAVEILKGLGYTVEFYYKETQFVDMYTLIKW